MFHVKFVLNFLLSISFVLILCASLFLLTRSRMYYSHRNANVIDLEINDECELLKFFLFYPSVCNNLSWSAMCTPLAIILIQNCSSSRKLHASNSMSVLSNPSTCIYFSSLQRSYDFMFQHMAHSLLKRKKSLETMIIMTLITILLTLMSCSRIGKVLNIIKYI